MLVLDLPSVVRSVSRLEAARWGSSLDALWAIGLANVKAQDTPEQGLLDDGAVMLSGDSFFVAAWALMLESRLDPVPEHGAVFVVPNRHTMVLKPVLDTSILPSCRSLLVFADNMFRQGPGSISPSLYWWRQGTIAHLRGRVRPGGVDFMPSDDFMDILNSLAE
jgi:hypothetical protein